MPLLRTLSRKPWVWSFVAMAIVWLVTVLFTGGASALALTQTSLTFASFAVIVGIGQMFVITLGPGNIDLSVPATMTLAGTIALKLMNVEDGMILFGLMISVLIGLAVGIGNYALIKILRIPPIIATLSMSFIVQSAAIWYNRGLRIKPPPALADFTTSATAGVPNIAILALLVSVAGWLLLHKNIYGRWISAIGQSMFAARMAGIPVDGTRLVTYLLCAVLASISGYLLASFSGGAALNMGSEYLLMSSCGGCHWRHRCRRRGFQYSGDLGSRPVPVSRRLHAQYLRFRRRFPADPDRPHHHLRHSARKRTKRHQPVTASKRRRQLWN